MSRPRRWRNLLPGVLAILALVAIAAAILVFARVGTVHGRKIRIYATVPEARGLSPGSEVWLAGRRVGAVDGVDFRSPASDTAQRLVLTLDVLDEVRSVIRRGATVDIRPGGNLVGAPVASITLGPPGAPPFRPGDTLYAAPVTNLDSMRASLQDALRAAPVIIASARQLAAAARSTDGSIGALRQAHGFGLGRVGASGSRLLTRFRSREGSSGRALAVGRATAYAREAIARVDSIRSLLDLRGGQHSIGRFKRDSTLATRIVEIRAQLDSASSALASARGTAGRLQHDSALREALARDRVATAALAADLRRNPLRYLAF